MAQRAQVMGVPEGDEKMDESKTWMDQLLESDTSRDRSAVHAAVLILSDGRDVSWMRHDDGCLGVRLATGEIYRLEEHRITRTR